jgi:hypothetical protein
VDVLEELKELATRDDGPGIPCELVLNTRVVGCVSILWPICPLLSERRRRASLISLIANLQDPEAGTVTTSTGEVYTADVIIGKSLRVCNRMVLQ